MYPPRFQAGTETKQKLRCHVIFFFFFFPILFLLCPGGNLKSYCAGTFARTREVLRVFPPACATPEYLLAPAWAVVPSLGAAPAT